MKKMYVKDGNELREVKLEPLPQILIEFPTPVQRDQEAESVPFRYPTRTALDRRRKVC